MRYRRNTYTSDMARGHPVDHLGRSLPDSDWPDDRAAPESLDLIRRFINTTNIESGADRFERAQDLDTWLAAEGFVAPKPFDADQRAFLRAVRESLRGAAVDHRDGADDAGSMQAFGTLVSNVRLRFDASAAPLPVSAEAREGSIDHLLGTITVLVATAVVGGTWLRFKACTQCSWAFYDSSKNRSSRWCSMSACGGRSKVRNHRARRRANSA